MLHQMFNELKNGGQYKTETKVFYRKGYDLNEFQNLQNAIDLDKNNEKNLIENISKTTTKNFKDFSKQIFKSDTTYILTNTSTYKNKWNGTTDGNGAIMKVYNSFNYTEDIKYEAKLLELPMSDDFKLIILPPNEVDVLYDLFNKLSSQGLTAATDSVQPLFTSICKLRAPRIDFSSTYYTFQHMADIEYNLMKVEYGDVKIDEQGVSIKVCTYMFPSNEKPRECAKVEFNSLKNSYFFGLMYKDRAIFTGQYIDVIKI